jgi:hypothetical protein
MRGSTKSKREGGMNNASKEKSSTEEKSTSEEEVSTAEKHR